MVEWNGGMDYWNAHLLYCAVLKSTVAERTSTARRTNIMLVVVIYIGGALVLLLPIAAVIYCLYNII